MLFIALHVFLFRYVFCCFLTRKIFHLELCIQPNFKFREKVYPSLIFTDIAVVEILSYKSDICFQPIKTLSIFIFFFKSEMINFNLKKIYTIIVFFCVNSSSGNNENDTFFTLFREAQTTLLLCPYRVEYFILY